MNPDIKKRVMELGHYVVIDGERAFMKLGDSKITEDILTLIKEILEDVDEKVVGKDDKQWWQVDDGYCGNCDFMPTDGSSDCKCLYRNNLRQQQRNALKDYKKGLGL